MKLLEFMFRDVSTFIGFMILVLLLFAGINSMIEKIKGKKK